MLLRYAEAWHVMVTATVSLFSYVTIGDRKQPQLCERELSGQNLRLRLLLP
jgi:hypothetical protein